MWRASAGQSRLALAALLAGAAGIAFSPILAKLAVDEGGVGPIGAAFWRVALAAGLFAIWLAMRGELRAMVPATGRARWLGLLVVPGLFFAGDLALWHWSFEFTPVANATVLANFSAVLVTLVGWAFLGEKPTGLFVVGGAIALFGVVWLTLGTATPSVSQVAPTSVGDVLALGAACFYAGYLLSIKQARARHTVGQVMCLSSAAAGLVLWGAALSSEPRLVPRTGEGWALVLALAVVSQCLGQGLIAFALARLTASLSAVTLLIQPVMAALWGWLILAQRLTLGQGLAGAVVLAGIFLARVASQDRSAARSRPAGSTPAPSAARER